MLIRQNYRNIAMMRVYKGAYPYNRSILNDWDSAEKGVYYLGGLNNEGLLVIYYIGKGCGSNGMRSRLYDHLERWRDVTHFGYEGGDYDSEIETHEMSEIQKYRPKYNVVGV